VKRKIGLTDSLRHLKLSERKSGRQPIQNFFSYFSPFSLSEIFLHESNNGSFKKTKPIDSRYAFTSKNEQVWIL
jgi:hypothetical protein